VKDILRQEEVDALLRAVSDEDGEDCIPIETMESLLKRLRFDIFDIATARTRGHRDLAIGRALFTALRIEKGVGK
jgi:flagellar motor switch protein FliM